MCSLGVQYESQQCHSCSHLLKSQGHSGDPCSKGCSEYHHLGIQHHRLRIVAVGVWEAGCLGSCHHQNLHLHHPHLQMYLPYQHSWWCMWNQVQIDQGWEWGRAGDIGIGGMIAWARELVIY